MNSYTDESGFDGLVAQGAPAPDEHMAGVRQLQERLKQMVNGGFSLHIAQPTGDSGNAWMNMYKAIVLLFDQDKTAGAFLPEDGDGGFKGAIWRMAREVDALRARVAELEAMLGAGKQVEELAMLVRMLCHYKDKSGSIKQRAMEYLKAHGLEGSPLRETATQRGEGK